MNLEYKPGQEQAESKLSEVYKILGANTPLEMSNLYTVEDQKLIHSGTWSDSDPNLITNRIKNILEQIDSTTLTEEEADWRNEILWFWYHHAISHAFQKGNRSLAQQYAEKAIEIQPKDHPNQITKLLYFLAHDKLDEAQEWAANIQEEPEKSTARDLVEYYKTHRNF